MSIAALSNAAFAQYVSSSSNVNASQQAFQSLQQSLAAGNLTAAQTAFNTYQALNQNLTSAGTGTSSTSQLSTDLTALGKAIASGDLAASQSAFATVQDDLKTTPSQAIAAAVAAANQTVSEIDALLSVFNTTNNASTNTDPLTALLDNAYGESSSTNANGTTTDPTVALLDSVYGANGASGAAPSITAASGSNVNSYA